MRVFLDANVLFSVAITSDGRSAAIIDLATARRHILCTSRHALAEAQRNIERKRPDAVDRLVHVVMPSLELVAEAPAVVLRRAADAGLPPSDAPILAAAMASRAGMLVTGDRHHFGDLYGRTLHGVTVCSLSDAINKLLE